MYDLSVHGSDLGTAQLGPVLRLSPGGSPGVGWAGVSSGAEALFQAAQVVGRIQCLATIA